MPSRNDPRVRVTEIGTPTEFRSPELQAEPQRIIWMRLLWSQRRFLLRAGVTGLVLSLVVALLLPRRYESQTRLMPPEQGGSGLAMLAALATKGGGGGSDSSSSSSSDSGMSGGLSRVATDFLGLKTSGALLVDILHGPTVQDTLIQKFDLRSRYHVRYWQDARKRLDNHTTIKEDRKSGIISIAVSDPDPRQAQEMAKSYVEALNGLLAQVSTSSARRERMFLEQRLRGARESLDAASQDCLHLEDRVDSGFQYFARLLGLLIRRDVRNRVADHNCVGFVYERLIVNVCGRSSITRTLTSLSARARTIGSRFSRSL